MDYLIIFAFGKKYKLPQNNIPLDSYFDRATTGKFRENNILHLDFSDEFKLAFDYIYGYLMGTSSYTDFSPETLKQAIILADYLGLTDILYDISMAIFNGYVDIDYDEFEDVPEFNYGRALRHIANNHVYDNLTPYELKIFNDIETHDIPVNNTAPFVAKLFPISSHADRTIRDIYKLPYSRVCQQQMQPNIVHSSNLPNTSDRIFPWKTNDELIYLTCSEPYKYLGTRRGGYPCCTGYEKDGVAGNTYSFNGKKAMQTNSGIIVFVDEDFSGNYIFSTDYIVYPELNVVDIV